MDANTIIILVCKVVGLAMGIVSILLGFFPKEANNNTQMTLLGIGLTSLALASLLYLR